MLEGKTLDDRRRFTFGYHDHIRTKDDHYVMFSLYDGSAARLYDVRVDPG